MGIRIKNLNKDYFSEGKRIRALVTESKVILFDEPLSNLDAKLRETRKDLRDFLTELKITAVYVTHDRVEALALSDAIAVMKDGSIMEIESPKKICFDSDHQFVADFIGRANLIEGKVKVIEDSYAIIDSSIGAIAWPKSSDTSPGNTVTLCIRPEFIKVVEKDIRENCNIFSGSVDSLVFVGEAYEGEIILADTRLITRIEPTAIVKKGDEITPFFDPNHCFVLSK